MKPLIVLLFALALIGAPALSQDAPTDSCVTQYDETVDYFPEKAELTHAEGFSVEYFNHYKVISITRPWANAADTDVFQYVLVQCGTPTPDGYEAAQVIEVPITSIVTMSTTYLVHLMEIDQVDALIGVDSGLYINSPTIVEKFEAGDLVEVGSGSGVNVETVLDLAPDLVMTYGSGFPEFDAHPVLLDAGVAVALNSEWLEGTPLGRAEWLKFTALFFNAEAEANTAFEAIVTEYTNAAALVADLAEADRPAVLWNAPFEGTWGIPGDQSYTGLLLRDAGASVILGDHSEENLAFLDFETVYEAASEADFWFPNLFMTETLDDLIAIDARYADLAPVINQTVYNNDARTNLNGGNDFYETGVALPHLILKDLIAILHPTVLPDHELTFFRRME
ncbi:MAG: ABC transporter substrate-binding protein [Anaerolineae bacterium]|jgi:iron complex transport system substrate-binding protein|nr:ABC transporter substrate-binding protein [Anaerolineae bacterium]